MNDLNSKPIVAHFSNTFFHKSETSIYHYLKHMKRFAPICLAWNLRHLDRFPFPRRNLYSLHLPRHTLKRTVNGIAKKLLKRDLYFEGILKERGVSIIHAHYGGNGVQALQLKRKLNIPLVTTFYGSDLARVDMIRPPRKHYKQLFQRGQLFLVEGRHMKEKLHALGCPLKKIKIQPIAIPVDEIAFRQRPPRGNNTVKLLFCGRFTEKKGLIYALEAFKNVREQFRNISFTAIGDGELKEDIDIFVKKHRLHDCVKLPGFLDYDDYLKHMEEADIFIHPSVTALDGDSEGGAPAAILEAQAMGLPVISTYHADIPNTVVPDRGAVLSAERDVDALTRNIIFLLENQHLWREMGKTGREFVEQYHDIKKETIKLEEKYKALVK